MRRLTLPKSEEIAIEHYLYDLSLPVKDRALNRLVFRSGTTAANWLGVTSIKVHHALGKRIYSPTHDKWFAVRCKKSGNDRKPI